MAKRLSPLIVGLVALALWLALSAAPPLALDLGAPGAARFLWGFYDVEAADGVSFRWSGPDARLVLHGASPGATGLALRLSGERLVAQGEPRVALARADATFAAFEVTPGWRIYTVLLPPGALAGPGGDARPLELRAAVSRPGAADAARDYRALGVPVDWLRLTPLAGAPAGALPRAAWLTALVVVAAAAARLVLPRRWPLVPALLGAPLALWAWGSPYTLAWALPAAPWATGGAAVLLAGAAVWRRSPLTPSPAAPPAWTPAATTAGVVALGAGVALMHTRAAVVLGLALAVMALVALGAPAGGLGAGLWAPPVGDVGRRRALALLGAIFLLALGLRLARIDELPFGLWRDEARHGLVALRIAEDPTYRPVYVLEERVHLPGLGLYPFAAALKLFGVHLWTMRLVTALAGAITVLPLYALAARLTGRRAVGLGAALLLAVSSWHISISRFSFPTVYEPLLSLTAWWLLLAGLRPLAEPGAGAAPAAGRRAGLWPVVCGLLAGALLGVAAQTYHIGRITPLAAGWLALLLLARAPGHWRRWAAVVVAAALGLAITIAPLVAYALARPGEFNDRVGDVFLLGPGALQGRAPLAALDANLGRHLLMFTAEGDTNGRHHAPFRPLLDILSGAGLLLGVAALLRRLGDWRSRFLLGAVAVGLVPGLLAVDAPHAMRTFGALAPVAVIAALGWAELARATRAPRAATPAAAAAPARGRAAGWRGAALAIGVAGLIGLNAGLYFGVMPRDPLVFGGFYPVQSWMGAYAGADGAPGRLYVPTEVRRHPSFAFLAAGRPLETFDGGGAAGARLSAPPRPGDRFLLTGYFAAEEAAALSPVLGPHAAPAASGPPFPDGRGPTYYVVTAP